MQDLEKLEALIIERLDEIRNKDNKTINEYQEYNDKQELLRKVHEVEHYIRKYIKDNK